MLAANAIGPFKNSYPYYAKMHEILHLYFALVRFALQNAIKCRYFVDFNDFDIAYCIHQAELVKQIITY